MSETERLEALFKEALSIKKERGNNYGNENDSAYSRALSLYKGKYRPVVGAWPIIQKASRIVTIAQQATEEYGGSTTMVAKELKDSILDILNYVAMYYDYLSTRDASHTNEKELNEQAIIDAAMYFDYRELDKRMLEGKFSTAGFAALANINEREIFKIRKGFKKPTYEEAKKLASALGVKVSVFYRFKEHENRV